MNAIQVLSRGLCPWLRSDFDMLEHALLRGRLGHAWLITGRWGIGKVNLALALAERLLGSTGPLGDLAVDDAVPARFALYEAADHRPDLHCLFPEGKKASIGVEQIREACRELGLSSLQGGAKVLLIEPAEAMTTPAANALLKTLEEPTPHTYVLLVSHQPGRLLPTIRSRCQKLVLRTPAADEVSAWISGGGSAPADGPVLAADETPFKRAERNVQSLNINSLTSDVEKLVNRMADPQEVADRWAKEGLELRLDGLSSLLRELMHVQLLPGRSNRVTEIGSGTLHTTAAALGLRGLLQLLENTERLLARRGSGLNEDLALRVLLLGFQDPNLQSRRS